MSEVVPIPTIYNYSTFGTRFIAFILDIAIIFFPCAFAGSLLPVLGGIILWVLYEPVLLSSPLRASLGKYLMRIQVLDLNGQQLTFRTALIREVFKYFSSAFLFLGYLVVLFTKRKQALHDLVADTIVVDGQSELPVFETWGEQIKILFAKLTKGMTASSPLSELERLQTLRERGALTDEEFQREKSKILATES